MLHRVLLASLSTFLERIAADDTRAGLPGYVHRELTGFLRCGVLAHGFARVVCRRCSRETLVAFSCKGRGFCPSCGGRRMAQSAAHLVDHVFPDVPVRQWAFTMPWRLRFLQRILRHLGLPSEPIQPAPARSPPQGLLGF